MYTEEKKKVFVEPECEISTFLIEDILTTSGEDNWEIGDI